VDAGGEQEELRPLFASLFNRLVGRQFLRGRVMLLAARSGFAFHGWSDSRAQHSRTVKAWATTCTAAGVEGLFHDLRLTALTNMIEAGLSEKEAMEISRHRTRAVLDR